jgi:hypothetical protein
MLRPRRPERSSRYCVEVDAASRRANLQGWQRRDHSGWCMCLSAQDLDEPSGEDQWAWPAPSCSGLPWFRRSDTRCAVPRHPYPHRTPRAPMRCEVRCPCRQSTIGHPARSDLPLPSYRRSDTLLPLLAQIGHPRSEVLPLLGTLGHPVLQCHSPMGHERTPEAQCLSPMHLYRTPASAVARQRPICRSRRGAIPA